MLLDVVGIFFTGGLWWGSIALEKDANPKWPQPRSFQLVIARHVLANSIATDMKTVIFVATASELIKFEFSDMFWFSFVLGGTGTNTINTCMHQNMKFMKHNPKSQRCTSVSIATQMWWQRSHGSYGYLVFLHWILLAASGHVQSATKFPSTACPLGVLWRSMRMAAFISPSLPNAQQPELWRHQSVRLRSMD